MRRFTVIAVLVLIIPSAARTCRAEADRPLWAVDCLTKVMRSATCPARGGDVLKIDGARGEVVSAQAVFRPNRDLAKATCTITGLRYEASNQTIPATAVMLQWVRYIDVSRNTKGVPADELVAKAPTSIPDPFWEDPAVPAKANQAQPVWIEIHIPRDAKPGDYRGTLTVTGADKPAELPVILHVYNFDMPAERHLAVVNWWRFPGLGFEQVKPNTEEYYQLLERFCRFLVDHRQTDVNTSISLILESGNAKDGYAHDTAPLERYAEAAFKAGIRQIQLHSAGQRTGKHGAPKSRIVAKDDALRRLAALEKVIQRRGWKRRFAVSISDEPFIHQEESYAQAVDQVHQAAPSVRVIEAIEAEYFGKLDIWVPKLSHLNLWYPRFDQARKDGAELWYYTCCHPVGRYPNRFLDQSLLKARVLHWINYLYDLDGYLHWGLNHFQGDQPYTEEAISYRLPLGDRAIVYPGKKGLLGSLRLSTMRNGLQDFEYLWVLQHRLAEIKEKKGKEAFWLDPRQRPLELCRRVIWSFHDYTRDPNVMLETRRAIAEEIEALQTEPLLVVQTSPPEGTIVPAGPRNVGIRGLAPSGATVLLNGKPLVNVRKSGYFLQAYFMPDDGATITVAVEHEGKKRTVQRTFKPTD
ncbi:MAG: DUF4091 domain-containing protein [Phycisphaerae bacterium]|nr:DUF4091 domain-containing protein [Phycisphaerae bacterium]